MKRRSLIGIGINTGTSADAIDAALVEFGSRSLHNRIELLWTRSYPYPAALKQLFMELVDFTGTLETTTWFDRVGKFDFALGSAFSDAAMKVIRASGISKRRISFIGSHGQTVWHAPYRTGQGSGIFSTGSTIQLGNPSVIAARTGIPVVAHFREKDVALRGQGAPLAPVLHFELFRNYAPAVVLNLGGIANITVIPSSSHFSSVYGFDTGPGNRLIDIAVDAGTAGRDRFDRGGKRAGKTNVDTGLLGELMQDAFVKKRPPKSTGRERYNKTYLSLKGIAPGDADTVATLTAFTAHAIVYNISHFVRQRIKNVIVCGGGANNRSILRHLSELLPGVSVRTARDFGYEPQVIEPMLFAYLGYLGFNRIPVDLRNITGSSAPFVPGGIYYP